MEYVKASRFEHRFWLQVLGDHARFIRDSLAPEEKEEIHRAGEYVQVFDRLLEQARAKVEGAQWQALAGEVDRWARGIREFKLQLLQRHLTGKIKLSLSPSFMNHMVNEVEEYIRILACLCQGQVPPAQHPVHHHLLWLSDASGHSGAISGNLDFAEKGWKRKSDRFTRHFDAFYLKAVELAGYLRTCLSDFPALCRFNRDVELEITLFQGFLRELEEMRLNDQLLGVLSPLMADHMFREECYYLIKLAEVSKVKAPNCDPGRPRSEN
ncbi:hypothetical protein HMPREF9374_1870 [Desmospora sp. 8437]|nr:hypothetical protein HMPREF9374_1870 [Desmospora sp. 8437]